MYIFKMEMNILFYYSTTCIYNDSKRLIKVHVHCLDKLKKRVFRI